MKTNRITESLKKEIASATARKILSELDWSTVNSYASKKQDRDMSRNNKNYGVNNLGDMRNVDDEEYWKRSDDIDAEYASNKKEAERRFIMKHFPNLEPSEENLNNILYAFDTWM